MDRRAAVKAKTRIHKTAIVERGAKIGAGTAVWDNVHIRENASIGKNCIVGGKTYIAYDVKIGDGVKINSFVYLPTGVTIEDRAMISAGCVFVNDKYPRAFEDGKVKRSGPGPETLKTLVKEGATVGAACTVLGGLTIGRYALVGAGSVVTKSVPDHALVVGNPARRTGWVCACGNRLTLRAGAASCACGKRWQLQAGRLFRD
jgi:acetyltransferase-like isoleucine patch superfamily enzyme